MLEEKQLERTIKKLEDYRKRLDALFFRTVDTLQFEFLETKERLHVPPQQGYRMAREGDTWGGEETYAWFHALYSLPESGSQDALFLLPDVGGYEGLLWVNGFPVGNFANKLLVETHGNHYAAALCPKGQTGTLDVHLSFYAGHSVLGTMPFSREDNNVFRFPVKPARICVKDQQIIDFSFDLQAVLQLAQALPETDFRRGEAISTLLKVFDLLWLDLDNAPEAWREELWRAQEKLSAFLSAAPSPCAGVAGLVGHSHMDTAWLWTQEETKEKCIRTFANQLSLMNEYEEYRFFQSSALHSWWIEQETPALFEKIRRRVLEGRWEQNGGVWVECDCNIPTGEALVRQFLWGQRYYKERFGKPSDVFWLPDTFGYSAALPQIMRSAGIRFFLTTKLSWNDTNAFPYETFLWEGLDGSKVFSHFNTTHTHPDVASLLSQLNGLNESKNFLHHKETNRRRLIAYGYGDGGGGPEFEMLEEARRVRALSDCPAARHVSVGDFMREMEANCDELPTHFGELYLELHRGTLTNQHEIKRNNRLAEQLLHTLEFLCVQQAVRLNEPADGAALRPLWEVLLRNQFHDILPGTCIPPVHKACKKEMRSLLAQGQEMLSTFTNKKSGGSVSILNATGFDRSGEICYLSFDEQHMPQGLSAQPCHTLLNETLMAVMPGVIPPYSSVSFDVGKGTLTAQSAFIFKGDTLKTPYYDVIFNEEGFMDSLIARTNQRQLRAAGLALGTFLYGEDVPAQWDNWDIDADLERKLKPCAKLLKREVVDDGPLLLRIRSRYALDERSSIEQDIIFYAHSPRIDFETLIHWHTPHRFLKADFDVNVQSAFCRTETQFGYVVRRTHGNTSQDRAAFEVCNHRYTDLSEPSFGVALLNDCKYGVSIQDSDLRLSLHKGGCRPDPSGDQGDHFCRYALFPHAGDFNASKVVKPAYCFQSPLIGLENSLDVDRFLWVDQQNVVIETIKPCEEQARKFIVRLYEAEGSRTSCCLSCGLSVKKAELVNVLEERLPSFVDLRQLDFSPFEIKTLMITF